MRRTRLVLLFGAVLLAGMAPAAARQNSAPVLVDSSPSNGETVHEAPARVEMTFSEPLDESSTIEVRDECNRRVDAGDTTVDLNEMSVGIAKAPSGVYVASYSATGLGGVTGTTDGSISFTVHMGSSCDGSGGGHGGHGRDDGGGDGNHDGHGSGGGSGGHSGGDHSGGDHSGADHSGTSAHAAGAHSSGGTTHAAGGHNGAHDNKGKGKGKHGGHGKHGDQGDGDAAQPPVTDLAAPGDLVPAPDGSTLLVALGASILFGAGGGLLVRVGVRL